MNVSPKRLRLQEQFPALRGQFPAARQAAMAGAAALVLPLLAEALFGPPDVKEG